jgi:hypothetical protein
VLFTTEQFFASSTTFNLFRGEIRVTEMRQVPEISPEVSWPYFLPDWTLKKEPELTSISSSVRFSLLKKKRK